MGLSTTIEGKVACTDGSIPQHRLRHPHAHLRPWRVQPGPMSTTSMSPGAFHNNVAFFYDILRSCWANSAPRNSLVFSKDKAVSINPVGSEDGFVQLPGDGGDLIPIGQHPAAGLLQIDGEGLLFSTTNSPSTNTDSTLEGWRYKR